MSNDNKVNSGGGPTGLQIALVALGAVLALVVVFLNPYWIGAIG